MSDLSRVEQLLRNALGEDIYDITPQSRVETLLVELNDLIEGMGGSVSPEDIATAVAAYLDEHLTNPTNPPIDTSLSIAGAAADSKKTGDAVEGLKEDLSEFQNEILIDGNIISLSNATLMHATGDATISFNGTDGFSYTRVASVNNQFGFTFPTQAQKKIYA